MTRTTSATDTLSALRAAARPDRPPLPTQNPSRSRPIRYTLDLDRELHKSLKRFALEETSDSSKVVRTLLELLRDDRMVAASVRQRLHE